MKTIDNCIPVVLASDDNYAPYLGVCIQSVITNASAEKKYHIYILDGGISEHSKKLIYSLAKTQVKIEFISVDKILKYYNIKDFPLNSHFTLPAYFRLFLPQLFPLLDKLIYIDCDTVVLHDLSELYNTNISAYYLAAVQDITIASHTKNLEYYYKKLKISDHRHYINSGVMVCNLRKMRQEHLTQVFLAKLQEIGKPIFVDQDIINASCEGNILYLNQRWNYTWHLPFNDKNYKQNLPPELRTAYLQAQAQPYILHFTSQQYKPWCRPDLPLSSLFWQYARQTPFYEEILYQNILAFSLHNTNSKQLLQQIVNRHKILRQYYRCKILSKVTWGNKRKHYKQKRDKLHEQVRKIRMFLK